ncbi:HAD family hydrolase [Chromobacterium sp. IIBBL 290-4]|uniref:HAD family hydrolase n=1 Tax=Chromobacterium sp. IIBBL 290-4 TaxID=2953890 RepID=UPI0020B81AF2|nr:HAD family hydrolase [Chromobacterium sp. IIBBL 290-4]UTH75381.1 HAD family hydrolase [Chromobacterium sp. IIBBL 290-4]
MNASGIKALLLDLDDTLFDDRHATEQAFAAFIAPHAARFDESEPELFRRWLVCIERHWRRFESGELTIAQQRHERLRDFLGQPRIAEDEAARLFQPYMDAYRSHRRLTPGAAAFLDATRHLIRIVVSNGGAEQQRAKLEHLGIAHHFRHVVTLDEAGAAKPDPRMFLHALALENLSPAHCLMVGDDAERDIAPARKLGMAAYQVSHGRHAAVFEQLSQQLQNA